MFTKFMLRPTTSLSIPLSPLLNPAFSKPYTVVSTRRIAIAAASLSINLYETLPYGPSLSKGHQPSAKPILLLQQDNENLFDENRFTRVFDISALRVSADQCYALESQLRGHLLNWPRIRNIARVSGDEIDAELQKYFNLSDEIDEPLDLLNRRIYGKAEGDGEKLSPVLYRDKLVKSFNSRGYEKFRNLARLSRPKRKAKKESKEIGDNKRNGCYLVEEVFDDLSEDEKEEDLSGLIGEDVYRLGKWKGSTRLLLLDERYAYKLFDEMPKAFVHHHR